MTPTDAARLGALEQRYAEILTTLGQIKVDVGELKVTLEAYIESRKEIQLREDELCDMKHEKLMFKLERHCTELSKHEKQLAKLEKAKLVVGSQWSLTKKILVGLATIAGYIGFDKLSDLLWTAIGGK